jgi:hypothetical protein
MSINMSGVDDFKGSFWPQNKNGHENSHIAPGIGVIGTRPPSLDRAFQELSNEYKHVRVDDFKGSFWPQNKNEHENSHIAPGIGVIGTRPPSLDRAFQELSNEYKHFYCVATRFDIS